MKAVILAGGLGTRISEETHIELKPMIVIGCKQATGYQRQRLSLAWFRTRKYHQCFQLRRFRDLFSVKAWMDGFVYWYNAEQPTQRHQVRDAESAPLRPS